MPLFFKIRKSWLRTTVHICYASLALGDFTVEIAGIPPDGYVKSVSVGRSDVLVAGSFGREN
ncbi:MAG TPA: hypothetical protein VFR18_09200 [Terriglobia bacterium]|nr:hypothetical protein [Terriglobia bacterium]